MKKILIAFSAFILSASVMMAQAPKQFSYQTVVRNAGGGLVASSSVGIRISILKTTAAGASQYSERHTVTTNANGLASLSIGTGTQTTGSLANIDWTNDAYFIKTEVDPNGGTNYTITGTSQILAAPYALNGVLNGKLGIGVANPTHPLELANSVNGEVLKIKGSPGESRGILFEPNGAGSSYELFIGNEGLSICEKGVSCERFHIKNGGNVGIGTSAPNALLHVNGFVNSNSGNTFAFYSRAANGQPSTGGSVQQVNDVSIIASNRIRASEFNAMSDARIKNVVGVSDGKKDLATINQIRITDYTFKDKVERGSKQMKKVIAQELEKVYPSAVSQTTEVIPDIFTMAAISQGWIACHSNITKGDRVKLVFENSSEIVEVLDANATGFKVASAKEGKVFVYGREVSDFRVVDYEALSTLNISATQELARKVAALEAENAALKAANQEAQTNFQSKIDQINARLEALLPAETAKK